MVMVPTYMSTKVCTLLTLPEIGVREVLDKRPSAALNWLVPMIAFEAKPKGDCANAGPLNPPKEVS